nr:hypothetical protein BaRGS_028204 [Batillaria attramentaria]
MAMDVAAPYSASFNSTVAPTVLATTAMPDSPLPCNGSGAPPMEEWSEKLNFYMNGVLTAIVTGLGLVGNALAVMVLTRRTMHTSTNCFLTALAIWDSVVLLHSLLLMSLGEIVPGFFTHALPYVIVYLYPVALVAQTATVWLTVSFTVERYIAVCHPLKAASMCTIQRARIVIVIISVISVLYNMPRWFEYTLMHLGFNVPAERVIGDDPNGQVMGLQNPISNVTCLGVDKTGLAQNSVYHKIYFGWLYFLVMCFIPLCSLAVLNAFLVLAVKRSQRQRKDMNVRQVRENNVTIMLVSVVMVFIVCQVPALIYNMAYAISMATVTTSPSWGVLSTLRNFLVNLNSAVNFILYCALGQKFRRTFVRTFCPCLVRRARDGFHSFTYTHHADGQVRSNSNNGAVYIKMLQHKAIAGKGKVSVAKANGTKSGKSDLQKVADHDSGVVLHNYLLNDI